jgi:hypothetical protein
MTEQNLKNKLLNLKKSEWKVEKNIFELALESLDKIGTTDPVLRDELILEFLFNSIVEKKLEKQEIKTLLKKCLSNEFLFYKIEEHVGDGVFKRSFTALIVRCIVYYHNEIDGTLLTKEEISEVFEKTTEYFRLEEDKRGYVPEKGWHIALGI